jgi:hydrogenase maturation protein HypF
LLNICNISNYEGQAAMLLEFTADENEHGEYPFSISEKEILIIDWQPMIENIITEINHNISNSIISARFHNTLAKIILHVANKLKFKKVILSGGCFQNAYLTEKTIRLLEANDFEVYWHQRIPPNDGGISVGQIAAYLSSKNIKKEDLQITSESKGS